MGVAKGLGFEMGMVRTGIGFWFGLWAVGRASKGMAKPWGFGQGYGQWAVGFGQWARGWKREWLWFGLRLGLGFGASLFIIYKTHQRTKYDNRMSISMNEC